MDVRGVLRGLFLLQAVCGQVPSDRSIYAWVGKDAILECRSQTGDNVSQVTWLRTENGREVNFLVWVIAYNVSKLTQFAKERVDFLARESTEGSIRIRNVTLTDEGVYTCILTIASKSVTRYKISLTVQVPPVLQLVPSPDPVLLKPPYETVATCIARAAKPAAKISWLAEGLDFWSSDDVLRHDDGTVTTQSQLRMIPRPAIYGHNVSCVISQHNGISDINAEQSLTIQNVHYPPDSVQVMVRILDDGSFQFTCVEDSNPPATSFSWRRKDGFGSSSSVELGNGADYTEKHPPAGIYVCEVANSLGRSSGYLYFYRAPGSSNCLHAWLWLFLILLLLVGGIVFVWREDLKRFLRIDRPTY